MLIRRLEEKRYRLAALVASLCLVSLVLDAWQNAAQRKGDCTWLDGTVCAAASPLQGLLSETMQWGERSYALLAERRRSREENAALRGRVAELQARLLLAEEASARDRRQEELRLAFAGGRTPLAAVIGWGDDGWRTFLLLDQGSSQGLRAKDVALTRGGVVGQVYAVTAGSARVLPLTDPSSQIAALVVRSREPGILRGVAYDRCELDYLDPEAEVRVGDAVMTSGLGGVFPKGLLLGSVVAVHRRPEIPGVSAEVRPAVALRKAEEVALVREGAAPR